MGFSCVSLSRMFSQRQCKHYPNHPLLPQAPVHYSNVAVIDPITGRAVRTGFRFTAEGTRVRVGKGRASSGTVIPIPDNTEDQDFRMDMGEY